jgi:hypothetical protein
MLSHSPRLAPSRGQSSATRQGSSFSSNEILGARRIIKEVPAALLWGQLSRDDRPRIVDQCLCGWKHLPQPRRLVVGGGDDALAVRAEGGGMDLTLMTGEDRDLLAGVGVPQPRRVVPGRGDDALAVRARPGEGVSFGEHGGGFPRTGSLARINRPPKSTGFQVAGRRNAHDSGGVSKVRSSPDRLDR